MKLMSEEEQNARYPHLREYLVFAKKLREESDRGAVLISTGFLEEQLRQVLAAFLIEDKAAATLLDGANAPLGTFNARITACYSMGLIDETEYHDLNQLRHIRNLFAHDIHASFGTQSIIDRCKTLRHKAHDYDSDELGPVRVSPSGQFTSAAISLILSLVNRPHYVGLERLKLRPWPL